MYNEWALCVKENDGDNDSSACAKKRQMSVSICPEEWVRFLMMCEGGVAIDEINEGRQHELRVTVGSYSVVLPWTNSTTEMRPFRKFRDWMAKALLNCYQSSRENVN